MHSKRSKDLYTKNKATQVLEETTGKIIYNFGMENVFLIVGQNIDTIKGKLIKLSEWLQTQEAKPKENEKLGEKISNSYQAKGYLANI